MIIINNLVKKFGQKSILKGINFTIKEGEKIAIIGPSGSGKSTLIRCLNLLEMPTSGEMSIDSLVMNFPNPSKTVIQEVRKRTGMVFQSFNLFPHLTAIQNVMQGLVTVQKQSKKIARVVAADYLAKVGLTEYVDHYPSQLSGGQQQRVAIARAIALKPKIILMDEPTSALDPELVQEVLNVIRAIAHTKTTLVIVTHELKFAQEVADRIMFIDQGAIVEFKETTDFFNNPTNERTQSFLQKFV